MNSSCLARPWAIAGAAALLLASNLHADPKIPTKAPAWDAGGLGLPPWQGPSALQVSPDGKRVVIGTIAPAEDPNVIVLDDSGKVAAHYAVGQQWIEKVDTLPDGGSVLALVTNPEGGAFDLPTVFLRGAKSVGFPPTGGLDGMLTDVFHYGDHSNHLGMRALSCKDGIWVTSVKGLQWHENGSAASTFNAPLPMFNDDSVALASAALPDGTIVVGCAVPEKDGKPVAPNVAATKPGQRLPIWTREAVKDLPPVPPRERGLYGSPTRANGQKVELEQWDIPMAGPLSIAVHADANGVLDRVATADYRGWQRWVRSSATNDPQNLGTRMMVAKPVVTVLDGEGKLVQRIEADKFAEPAWLDLKFLPDGKKIVAWPHHWTARGLASTGFLPADPDARTIYLLNVETGDVSPLKLPDAIADLTVTEKGDILLSCWGGGLYRLGEAQFAAGASLPKPVEIGGAALVSASADGQEIAVARADGVVIGLDGGLAEKWRADLNALVPRASKKWVNNAKEEPVDDGLWGSPGGRLPSDLGGQSVIEAPDGLILIEAHSGLSFEREWAALKNSGLDPMKVKYVLVTHEHGDHAPGARLWHAVTGAQLVTNEEGAYTLQHHIPINSGYGFNSPVPPGITVKEDTELDLAGLKVKAIRAPGHTQGAMAWVFEKGGKRYMSTGDLIMPTGLLGYSGSPNFSPYDVLATMKKLKAMNPDVIWPGHGKLAPPSLYLDAGIEVAEKVGWGVMPPTNPDPRFRLTQDNVIVGAWNQGAQSAAFGDFNGDGKLDFAILTVNAAKDGSVISLFYNRGAGKFDAKPDKTIEVPGVMGTNLMLRTALLNGDNVPDFMAGGTSTALLLSKDGGYETIPFKVSEIVHILPGEDPQAAPVGIRLGGRFGAVQEIFADKDGKFALRAVAPEIKGSYVDLRRLDVNGDGKPDVVSSCGNVLLKDGPAFNLLPPNSQWRFFAVGDFNGDKKPDLFLTSWATNAPSDVYLNTGDPNQPYANKPDQTFTLAPPPDPRRPAPTGNLTRDTIAVTDFNGDGYDDLLPAIGQGKEVQVIFGGPNGFDLSKTMTIPLDYITHHENGLFAGDFNGDKKPDIATLGWTNTGVGAGGPPAVYIWCQP